VSTPMTPSHHAVSVTAQLLRCSLAAFKRLDWIFSARLYYMRLSRNLWPAAAYQICHRLSSAACGSMASWRPVSLSAESDPRRIRLLKCSLFLFILILIIFVAIERKDSGL